MKLDERGKIEKEKNLFFLSDISVYVSYLFTVYSLLYTNDFLMI